jgi:hypothetical protein
VEEWSRLCVTVEHEDFERQKWHRLSWHDGKQPCWNRWRMTESNRETKAEARR